MYLTNDLDSKTFEEIRLYDCHNFQTENWQQQKQFPLPDEAGVAQWQEYEVEAADMGAIPTLQKYLVQLQFPIQLGISDHLEYRQVTRQGKSSQDLDLATGLDFNAPSEFKLLIHQTIAGKIPVIIAGDRQDFVTLVQALTKRNEPQAISDSMGACLVSGYNNWHRIHQYRQRFLQQHPQGNWQIEFAKLKLRPELFQDRFILLSRGAYSNVAAIELGLNPESWQQLSGQIRLEHECTHYVTRRLLGSMNNNAFDELIADYHGLVAACGYFPSDWFLRFMGLTESGFQEGGRLVNYLGNSPICDRTWHILQQLVIRAARNLELFDRQYYRNHPRNDGEKLTVLIALTQSNLRSLAAVNAVSELLTKAERAKQISTHAQSVSSSGLEKG